MVIAQLPKTSSVKLPARKLWIEQPVHPSSFQVRQSSMWEERRTAPCMKNMRSDLSEQQCSPFAMLPYDILLLILSYTAEEYLPSLARVAQTCTFIRTAVYTNTPYLTQKVTKKNMTKWKRRMFQYAEKQSEAVPLLFFHYVSPKAAARWVLTPRATRMSEALPIPEDRLELCKLHVWFHPEDFKFLDEATRFDREVLQTTISAAKRYESHGQGSLGELCRQISRTMSRDAESDREVARSMVSAHGPALRYFPAFQADRDVVLAAVNQSGHSLRFADIDLRQDWDMKVAAVRTSPELLRYVPEPFRRELVRDILETSGCALRYFPSFTSDRELVLTAVSQDGLALQYASRDLLSDWQVVSAAVRQSSVAIFLVPPSVRNNRAFAAVLLEALPSPDARIRQYLHACFPNDRYIIRKIPDVDPTAALPSPARSPNAADSLPRLITRMLLARRQ